MFIRNFAHEDIATAATAAFEVWADDIADDDLDFNRVMFEYLVRFYDINRDFSFSYDDGGVQAILLAGFRHQTNDSEAWFMKQIRGFAAHKQAAARRFKQYLEYNSHRLKSHAASNDLLLNLFLSRKKGCGLKLLKHVQDVARRRAAPNLLLWADVTCHMAYYPRQGFSEISRFLNPHLDKEPMPTVIYKKATA